MKSAVLSVIFALLSFGENFGQIYGNTVYRLRVVEDVTLERGLVPHVRLTKYEFAVIINTHY